MSNPPAAPDCPVAAPMMPFIGLDFCLSSHSARISGSTGWWLSVVSFLCVFFFPLGFGLFVLDGKKMGMGMDR